MKYEQAFTTLETTLKAVSEAAYAEGYRQGRFDAEADKHLVETQETAQQARDRIVEQAKSFVRVREFVYNEENRYYIDFDYVVNREKRMVVALGRRRFTFEIVRKGVAKCDPDDCFNVHIGKAIALRRALGLEVPAEYLNAPQPTEVRVGDVLYLRNIDTTAVAPQGHVLEIAQRQLEDRAAKIIDDSREVSE